MTKIDLNLLLLLIEEEELEITDRMNKIVNEQVSLRNESDALADRARALMKDRHAIERVRAVQGRVIPDEAATAPAE